MNDSDLAIVETASERRVRLTAAFIYGPLDARRRLAPLHKRLLVGVVIAAVAVAVCAGVSFVMNFLAERAAKAESAETVSTAFVDMSATDPNFELRSTFTT